MKVSLFFVVFSTLLSVESAVVSCVVCLPVVVTTFYR